MLQFSIQYKRPIQAIGPFRNLTMPTPTLQVLVVIFPNMDTLDFAAPFEVLSIPNRLPSLGGQQPFKLTIAASATLTPTSQGANIERHLSIEVALARLADFNILVVPGGRRETVINLCKPEHEVFQLVKSFVELPHHDLEPERIVLSICTGAFFLGSVGCLTTKKATTSHLALDVLKEFCQSTGGAEIVTARFVDAGLLATGTRVITSGGISCGLDASLHVVEICVSVEVARQVTKILEYAWRREEGMIVDGRPVDRS